MCTTQLYSPSHLHATQLYSFLRSVHGWDGWSSEVACWRWSSEVAYLHWYRLHRYRQCPHSDVISGCALQTCLRIGDRTISTATGPGMFWRRAFHSQHIFRSLASAPLADLYVVGFPCQPFSQAGLENGFDARGGNGVIFFAVLHYIKNKQPRAFILENVVGIEWICAGSCFESVLRELYSLASYNIYWQMMDTQNHGIPHSRPRYYFIGILKRWDRGTFTFPEPCRSRPLESFLENQVRRPTPLDLPPENQKVARANVIAFLEKMQAKGHDVLSETWTLDCDSSLYRAGAMHGVCCCLTRSRPLGHWISNRGRRLTLLEHKRLQGISDDFPVFIGEMEFRQHLGNSMSVNVLERLLVSLLPAAGLWDTSLLRDRYADSTTVA